MKKSPDHDSVRAAVIGYYTDKVARFGATPRGVDWNSAASQTLRFQQLLKIVDGGEPAFSINDYGCGYGALIDCLQERGGHYRYVGFDPAAAMIRLADERYRHLPHCRFCTDEASLTAADYTVASGIFNVKLDFAAALWERYCLATLDSLRRLSRKGFAFNMLTTYADTEKMRPDLYHADPLALFQHCRRRYSRYVALLHDYPLYEFTILVRT